MVKVSIDGASTHNANRVFRDGSGSWKYAIRGFVTLLNYFDPLDVRINWVVTPSTVRGISDGLRLLVEQYNAANIHLLYAYEGGKWDTQALSILKGELKRSGELVMNWLAGGKKVFFVPIHRGNSANFTC